MQGKDQIKKTYVYIDAANLHSAMRYAKYSLDYAKFFVWLTEEFKTKNIYLFIGYIKANEGIYNDLREIGYTVIFKKTLRSKGKIKGNCDAELVLRAATDIIEKSIDSMVLVSSDGDFSCLLEFALARDVAVRVVSPSQKLSYLIRKMNINITWMQEMIHHWVKD